MQLLYTRDLARNQNIWWSPQNITVRGINAILVDIYICTPSTDFSWEGIKRVYVSIRAGISLQNRTLIVCWIAVSCLSALMGPNSWNIFGANCQARKPSKIANTKDEPPRIWIHSTLKEQPLNRNSIFFQLIRK